MGWGLHTSKNFVIPWKQWTRLVPLQGSECLQCSWFQTQWKVVNVETWTDPEAQGNGHLTHDAQGHSPVLTDQRVGNERSWRGDKGSNNDERIGEFDSEESGSEKSDHSFTDTFEHSTAAISSFFIFTKLFCLFFAAFFILVVQDLCSSPNHWSSQK